MRRLVVVLVICFTGFSPLMAQSLPVCLPESIPYDTLIPRPDQYFGFPLGKWHLTYEQISGYLQVLAKASNRVKIEVTGRTHEDRPLLLLTISLPGNLSTRRLGELRSEHLELSNPERSDGAVLDKMPVVVYNGFSVHGNEPSGANASIWFAYYLAASKDPKITAWLDQSIVLVDPCLNPDGLNRHAQWANQHAAGPPVAHPDHREHREGWPNGRTNHFWFDLNRDWLPVQHPESQARLRTFHRWKPNVLTDHHEMRSHGTFFFQPGVPSRTNPLTPNENQELTAQMAEFHAKMLDQSGQLYFTRESFDDFYYGKGSTYPDVNGGVGILFEQSASAGRLRATDDGPVSFAEGICNQFSTALSTLEGAVAMRMELLEYQRAFYQRAFRAAQSAPYQAYVFDAGNDAVRLARFTEVLLHHQVRVYELTKSMTLEGLTYTPERSIIVPMKQAQFQTIRALFESPSEYNDSLFYDVSAWNLPLAFDLDYATVEAGSYANNLLGTRITQAKYPEGMVTGGKSDYAYLVSWESSGAPAFLASIQRAGVHAKVATKAFQMSGGETPLDFDRGTLLIGVKGQSMDAEALYQLMQTQANAHHLTVHAVPTGLATGGIDLGSPSFENLKPAKVLLVVGSGVGTYEAGAAWMQMAHRTGIEVVLVDKTRLPQVELSDFTTVVMVDGRYGELNDRVRTNLYDWMSNGGTLLLERGAIRWAEVKRLASVSYKEPEKRSTDRRPYALSEQDRGKQRIGGAIMDTYLDRSHPLGFGLNHANLPLMHRGTIFLEVPSNPYASPVLYTEDPVLAGFCSDENQNTIKNSAAVVVSGIGAGRSIAFATDFNFRGFFDGSSRVFVNAVFFGSVIRSSTTQGPKPSSSRTRSRTREE